MLKYIKPEEAGVSSENIKEYVEYLEKNNLSTHDLIIGHKDRIFFEKYWAPFDKDFLHRMYSVTKSFVGIAVGFLEQDGLISLDDRIDKYFPEETKDVKNERIKEMSIRNMLTMRTTRNGSYWFRTHNGDRVKQYFEDTEEPVRPSGTVYSYDSAASFILGSLVERLTGKNMMDYMREKFLDKIGFSKEAYCLKCPGGHTWADSALLCKPSDLYKVALFMMNKGSFEGEQLLNEKYAVDAVSKQTDNNVSGICSYNTLGYGYYIWRTYDNSFSFNGMGSQFAICVPDKELIMIYNGDNQGNTLANRLIFDGFFNMIVRRKEDVLPQNEKAYNELTAYTRELKLNTAQGAEKSDFAEKINGKIFKADKNNIGIESFSFNFAESGNEFRYRKNNKDMVIKFGMKENIFDVFPEDGYSDEVGGIRVPGNRYRCAASAAWVEEQKLYIKVQIVDKYFGKLDVTAAFVDDMHGALYFTHVAEDFLWEYGGYVGGYREE